MKEKRRSNEKRKEKSRDAARCRRSRETDIFLELAGALPVPDNDAQHLDKASIMRLAIAYLKTRSVMDSIPGPIAKPEISSEMDELFLKALDGFVLVLSSEGDMVYISANVRNYLGIAQLDLMGQSVFEYSHPCDHDDIRDCFSMKPSEIKDSPSTCNFFMRLKCTLTSKGRKVNLKSASYKVIHCTGRLVVNSEKKKKSDEEDDSKEEPIISLVLVASPVPHPSNIEVPLGKYTFLSKHNLNMKFTYADDKLAEFLGWESKELIGQPVFDFHHALDNKSLDKSFKSLFSKGQCETLAYRFLNKTGGYAWVITQAALIHCTRLQKPLSVVCVNYIISEVEFEDEIYSSRQLVARESQEARVKESEPFEENPVSVTASLFGYKKPVQVIREENKENFKQETTGDISEKPTADFSLPRFKDITSIREKASNRASPLTTTASIFAPRTEDMNKGFLTFSEDQPGLTMLKDEPDDLTHLAPTAGDVCVPLGDPLISDVLDDIFFNNNYSLSPASALKDSEQSILGDPLSTEPDGDPFIYRDTLSRCSFGTELNSPTLTKSPEVGSGESLNSPNDSGGGLSEDEMLMLNINDVMADDELAFRAPYIPMSDQDEALQLFISDDMVMWGPTQPDNENKKQPKWTNCTRDENTNTSSSLAQLLTNETCKKIKDNGETLVSPAQVFGQISLKNPTNEFTAERERTNNKRVHNFSNKSPTDNKRIKCADPPLTSQLLQQLISAQQQQQFPNNKVALGYAQNWRDNMLCPMVENLSDPKCRLSNDDEGGGKTSAAYLKTDDDTIGNNKIRRNNNAGVATAAVSQHALQQQQQQQQQQSNSVLMNLLVSGCDPQTVGNLGAPLIKPELPGEGNLYGVRMKPVMDQQINLSYPAARKPLPAQAYENNIDLDDLGFINSELLKNPGLLASLADPRDFGAFGSQASS